MVPLDQLPAETHGPLVRHFCQSPDTVSVTRHTQAMLLHGFVEGEVQRVRGMLNDLQADMVEVRACILTGHVHW